MEFLLDCMNVGHNVLIDTKLSLHPWLLCGSCQDILRTFESPVEVFKITWIDETKPTCALPVLVCKKQLLHGLISGVQGAQDALCNTSFMHLLYPSEKGIACMLKAILTIGTGRGVCRILQVSAVSRPHHSQVHISDTLTTSVSDTWHLQTDSRRCAM